jgi:hypothetical protein
MSEHVQRDVTGRAGRFRSDLTGTVASVWSVASAGSVRASG